MFCFEQARIGGCRNRHYFNRLKTYQNIGTWRDFYLIGQEKLLMLIMSYFLKPGLHIVVTVAEHACDDASKRILKLLIYPLQIFLVKHQYL